MSSSTAKMKALISVLQEANDFDAERCVETIRSAFVENGTLPYLTKHMIGPGTRVKEYDGFVEGIRADSAQDKNLSALALTSIGKSLHQFNDRVEPYGFRKGVDKGRCQEVIQDSLTGLLPLMLRCHIDEAIKKYNETTQRGEQDPFGDKPVFVGSLDSYVKNGEVLSEFRKMIFSKEFLGNENFFKSEERTTLSNNSWMNVLFVYLYLKNEGQLAAAAERFGRFDGTSFPKVIEAQQRLSELQAWLDNNTAMSEGAAYSTALLKMASVDKSDQSPLKELKDKTTFINDILSKAPLTDVIMPQHKLDVVNLPSATYLAARLPTWTSELGLDLDLYPALGEASQSFMKAFSFKWNAFIEDGFNQVLQKALEDSSKTPEQFSVRGRNIALPVTFEVREYGSDIADEVSGLEAKVGTHLFSLVENERTRYVEGDTSAPILVSPFSSREEKPLLPDNAQVMIYKDGNLVPRPEGTDYSGSGCFIQGTMVWTSLGEVPIERLQENDRILTAATSAEYGVKSDEIVAIPTGGRAMLWGFNDEDVFFTAGHVFHTTTGHRAIDPVAAKRENPWLEVGKLRVGHTLFRTTDGETYEHVAINHLHSRVKECDHVWGIHLREGLRSYHANGYLVRLNYPEITVKSVADMIKTLSSEQSMAIMRAITDLKPIFDRFGSGTVEQLLRRELSDDEFLRNARHKPQEHFDPQPLFFQSRSFDLDTYKGGLELPQDYYLPEIDALDGVLYINGEPIERSKVDARGFSWSRSIDDNLWEHGMCSFGHDKSMVSGDGLLWLDSKADPTGVPPQSIRFFASSTALRDRYTTAGLTGDNMLFNVPVRQLHLKANSISLEQNHTTTKSNEDISETEKLLLSDGDASTWFATQETLDEKRNLADRVEGLTPRASDNISVKEDLSWQLSYDRSPYDENEEPRNTLSYLRITRAFKSEPGAPPTMTLKIPFLDKLAQARQIASKSATQLTYYTSGFTITSDHKQDISLTITNGEAIALAADDNVDEDGYVKSYENLTFKKAGFEEELPFLFSKVTMRVHNIENTLKGRIAQFNEQALENVGKQHWIVGSPEGTTVTGPITKVGGQSPAVLSPTQPATPTRPSPSQNLMSLVNLGRGLGVDSETVKDVAQKYIYKAMLYHMDDTDRQNFTREAKPSTAVVGAKPGTIDIGALPNELAGGLKERLRDWLATDYSRAYIANMMSQMSESDQRKMGMKFTEDDKKRLKYFWQGRGTGCLSRSEHYSELNTIANTIAFRNLYPSVMNYITDNEAEDIIDENGQPLLQQSFGRKWAYKYFHALTTEDWVNQNADQSAFHELTRRNPLEFHCTILSALWIEPVGASMDGTKLAKILTEMVHRKIKDNALFAYSLMAQGADLATGMNDFMGPLIDLLMDDDRSRAAGIDPGVRQKLLADMDILIDREKVLADKAAQESKQAYNKAAAGSVRASMSALLAIKEGKDYTWKGAKSIFEFVRKLRAKPPVGEIGIELPPMGKQPLPEIPAKPPVTGEVPSKVTFGAKALAVAGLLFSVAATVFYVVQTWDSWKRIGDAEMSGLERTELICTGLQTIGGLAFNAYRSVQLFKYGFKGPPKGASTGLIQEAEHAAADNFEKAVKRRQSWMNPQNRSMAENPILQKRRATAPMRLAENTSKSASVNEQILPKKQGMWKSIQGKMQFDALETSIRGFAIAVTVVLITTSIISAIQNWGDKSPLEKWMTVIGIIIQIVSVIIEIAVLFTVVSPFLTVGIIVIGLIYQLVCFFTQAKKEPEDTPAQTWYKNVWPKVQASLPALPPTRFKWSVTPEGAKVGDDQTIEVIGKATEPTADTAKNLSKIQLTFTVSVSDGAGLLNSTSMTQVSGSSVGTDQVSVVFPDTFASYTTASISDTRVSATSLTQITASIKLQDAGKLYSQPIYKDNMPFLDKSLATGTEIRFLLRGKVNRRMRKPEGAKSEDADIVPAWGKYYFKVEEQYTDDTGSVPEQVVEDELVFKKLM